MPQDAPRPPDMPVPELDPERRKTYDFYKLATGPDGCPMKRLDDGRLVFHPILIPYLVLDYCKLHQAGGRDPACLDYAEFVMAHALGRADPAYDELVFTYCPGDGLSYFSGSFYSALTQAWYVRALCRLEELRPGKYQAEIRRAFASLLIPLVSTAE